ncbi:MAG: hypothetical protein WED05_04550 [Candidatus Atabeyarchaeum deiterrae]
MTNGKTSRSKSLALVGIMGALGNVLALISITIAQLPSPIAGQVAVDLSNLAIVVVAVYAGWRLGWLTGLIAGFMPGIMYGFVTGTLGFLGPFGLMLGKSFTGLTVGALARATRLQQKKRAYLLVIPIVLVGYVPEFMFTVFFFLIMVPFFIAGAAFWVPLLVASIAVKAWVEMILISLLMAAFVRNSGFNKFIRGYLGRE